MAGIKLGVGGLVIHEDWVAPSVNEIRNDRNQGQWWQISLNG